MNKLYYKIKNDKIFKIADIIFIAVLLIGILSIYFFTVNNRNSGAYAEIYNENKLVKTMSLNTDAEYTYIYNENEYNIITVKDGKISVTESSCNEKICINYPSTNTVGSTIICLPHKMLIIIKGEQEIDGIL